MTTLYRFRWSKVYESSEEELHDFLQSRGIQPVQIAADAGMEQPTQTTAADTTLWCAEGSLYISPGTSGAFAPTSLQPGDAIRIPAGTGYNLRAGISGYVCYLSVD